MFVRLFILDLDLSTQNLEPFLINDKVRELHPITIFIKVGIKPPSKSPSRLQAKAPWIDHIAHTRQVDDAGTAAGGKLRQEE